MLKHRSSSSSAIIRQNFEPVRRPETVCPVCKGYMVHKGFELGADNTRIVIHYGCNECGVHIEQHFACKYLHTKTSKFQDRDKRRIQEVCYHNFIYRGTRSSGVSPDCRLVWDNFRCSRCGKIEHRNEHYESIKDKETNG